MKNSLLIVLFFSSLFASAQINDTLVLDRLLSIEGQVPLDYNSEIRQYIYEYTMSSNKKNSEILRKFQQYNDTLSSIFIEHNVPEELRFACISLSECDNLTARSEGRQGFFKMRYILAKKNSLYISNYMDERRDVIKSAEVFCKELARIFTLTNDWRSALTIYCSEDAEWQKARILSHEQNNDFWEVVKYLPFSYRSEYPKYVAAVYLFHFYNEHGITIPSPREETQEVLIKEYSTLYQLSKNLEIDIQQLRELNPTYTKNIVPATGKDYYLKIPSSKVSVFENLGYNAYTYSNTPANNTEVRLIENTIHDTIYMDSPVKKSKPQSKVVITYTIKRGEILSILADLFDCKMSDIRKWNNIKGDKIDAGQKIKLYVLEPKEEYYKKIDKMSYSQKKVIRSKD